MEFKKGDRVRCKPGYTNLLGDGIPAWEDMSYGGFGYQEGRVFIIEKIMTDDEHKRIPVFGKWLNGHHMIGGVFIDAIEPCALVPDFNLKKFSFAD